MIFGKTEWEIQLIDDRTRKPIADTTGQCAVLVEGTGRPATIYKDGLGTAFTLTLIHASVPQPITFVGGRIRFFTDETVTAVDITGITGNGYAFFIKSAVPSQHRHTIFPSSSEAGIFAMPYVLNTNTAVTGASVDSGFDLPANVLVRDVFTDALEASTGGGLSVGTSTTISGFLLGAVNTVVATGLNWVGSYVTNYGSLLVGSYTATAAVTRLLGYRRASATSGARLVYANVATSTVGGSGLVYFRLERLPGRSVA